MTSTFTAGSATLAAGTFSPRHILLTAGLTAVLALVAGTLLKVRGLDLVAVTVLTFAATWPDFRSWWGHADRLARRPAGHGLATSGDPRFA